MVEVRVDAIAHESIDAVGVVLKSEKLVQRVLWIELVRPCSSDQCTDTGLKLIVVMDGLTLLLCGWMMSPLEHDG